jgi:hypothetical protein
VPAITGGGREEEDDMARMILILGLALGFWLRDFQIDRGSYVASPSGGDVQIMDGSDPFPDVATGR